MGGGEIISITELLMIAVAVAILTKYIKLPYTVALVLVGLIIGFFSKYFTMPGLSKDLIMMIFLPPLLFEGALNMDLQTLFDRKLPVGLLAFFGTFICTALIGVLINLLLGIDIWIALFIGAMLSPTDPISVLATFKECGVSKGLATIVEGESVFNDGIGIVVFLILLDVLSGKSLSAIDAVMVFTVEVGLGAIIGISVTYVALKIFERIDNYLIEITLSIVLSYGVYIFADKLHSSGVVAVVLSGLLIGNYGKVLAMTPQTRITLTSFWEVATFLINSLLFLLIGTQIKISQLLEHIGSIFIIFGLLLLVRSILVYGFCFLCRALKHPIPVSWMHVINWGGLRGSIPIALVLGIPATDTIPKDLLISLVFGVVFLSLIIQGVTIKKLLQRLGLSGASHEEEEYQKILGRMIGLKNAISQLEIIHDRGEVLTATHKGLSAGYTEEIHNLQKRLMQLGRDNETLAVSNEKRVLQHMSRAKQAGILDGFQRGLISEEVAKELLREINSKLEDDGHC